MSGCLEVDYRAEPVPPLPEAYHDWLRQLLESKGLR
jgi:hypothetical protein